MTAQMAKYNKHTYFLLLTFSAAAGRPSAGRVLLLSVVGVHVSACSGQTGIFHVPACFPSLLERFWRPVWGRGCWWQWRRCGQGGFHSCLTNSTSFQPPSLSSALRFWEPVLARSSPSTHTTNTRTSLSLHLQGGRWALRLRVGAAEIGEKICFVMTVPVVFFFFCCSFVTPAHACSWTDLFSLPNCVRPKSTTGHEVCNSGNSWRNTLYFSSC